MTGTADTEAAEFGKIYKLDVTVIPTNRADDPRRPRRPGLPHRARRSGRRSSRRSATATSAASRCWSARCRSRRARCSRSCSAGRRSVPHEVLNAKYHEREAEIVAQAGRKGAVTIATNMAGRGTDILLGGNPEGLARAEADPATEPEAYQEALRALHARPASASARRCSPPAACTSWAPSATSRGASTTSSAAAPAARATPAPRASTCRSRTT